MWMSCWEKENEKKNRKKLREKQNHKEMDKKATDKMIVHKTLWIISIRKNVYTFKRKKETKLVQKKRKTDERETRFLWEKDWASRKIEMALKLSEKKKWLQCAGLIGINETSHNYFALDILVFQSRKSFFFSLLLHQIVEAKHGSVYCLSHRLFYAALSNDI